VRACIFIQKIIQVEDERGQQHHRAFEDLLGGALQLCADQLDRQRHQRAEGQRRAHPCPGVTAIARLAGRLQKAETRCR
jgi:hypothetical protein